VPRSTRRFRPCLGLGLALIAATALTVEARQRAQFRAGVELVSLNVTVTDASGRYVTDLEPADFLVVEDGRPQEVVFFSRAASPLAVSILVDTSGSMRRDLPLAKDAAWQFVTRLRPGDLVQVVEFDRRLHVLQDFTDDRAALQRAVGRIRLGGATSLYNAVYVALDLFRSLPVPQEDEIRRDVIVVLSDGADTSSLIEFDQVLEAARRSPIVIYAIGLGLSSPRGQAPRTHPTFALRRLAQDTGGRMLEARTGQDLSHVYTDIANELSSQYVLGYVSNQPSTSTAWRPISVRVQRPGLQARTRAGYYAIRPGSLGF
jgi:Ca-activated chloride channel homolog